MDFASLKLKNDLNREIWDSEDQLKPEVRDRLFKIAIDFYKELGIDAELKDVVLVGSLANYNWSSYSDADIHLVVDYDEVDENYDLVSEYFRARKSQWNDKHDITVHDFDVEVYVEDEKDPPESGGRYSIADNNWDKKPSLEKQAINRNAIKRKASLIMKLIDGIIDEPDHQLSVKLVDKLTDKLSRMRKCGLQRNGEFSVENLTYKILRRNKYLDKLHSTKTDSYDSFMTL